MKEIKFKRFSAKATNRKRATLCSAGYGLSSAENVTIAARSAAIVSTNIDMKFNLKLVRKIYSCSNLSARSRKVGAGVADSGYRGISFIILQNLSCRAVTFNLINKIAQMLFEKISLPVLSEVFEFDNQTEHGAGAFSSTN